MNDGSLIFDTEVDTSGVEKGKEKIEGIFGDLVGANVLGNFLTSAMQTAGTKLADLGEKGLTLASDLQEVQNVVDTTFDDGAEQIYRWADAAKESFGMSSLQAQNFNGTLGSMLKSMQVSDEAITKMSTDMVGLAGDMASFYNIDVSAAFEKIRSGISGETEPLKQLGINMSVANLEAYALAQGIETAYSKMSQAEQATLRYNYLMSVTADAQGDFAKTSESYANQQRIFDLNMDNLAATAGEKVLPVLNETVILLNEELPKAVPVVEEIGETAASAIEFVVDNGEAVITTIAAGTAAVVTYGVATKGAAVAQAAFNAVASLNPYALIASAAVAAVVGLVSFADSLSDTSSKYKELAEESLKAAEEQEQAVDSLETELESVNKKIDEIQAKGTLSITDAQELTNLQLENEQLQIQLELEKEILATKRAQSQDNVIGALSMSADYEGSIAYAQNQLDEYKRLQDEIAYWNGAIIEAQETGDENLKYVAETYVKEYSQKALEYKVGALEALQSVNEFAEELDGTTEASKAALTEVEKLNKSILEYFGIAAETKEETETATSPSVAIAETPARIAAEALAKKYADEAKAIDKAKRQSTEKLHESWETLEHEYASSTTMTEEELYAKKREIWNKYGDESYKEHWDYYEDLIQHDKNFAAEQARLAEENAAKQKAELEKRYDEQFNIVDDGLNDIISAHKEAYSELERQREAYRNKLMAIGGDLFSVDVSEDKDGKEVTTYTVNNLDEQLRKMKEYHRQISSLKKQGASAGLLEELTSLGDEESAQFAKYLSGMSQTEFAKINELYKEKDKLAKELSAELYQSEAQDISDSMTSALADLATSAYSYGASAAEQFSAGFSAAANELGMGALYNQIQAQGATRSYENYVTNINGGGSQVFEIKVDVSGESAVYLDGKKVGTVVTEHQGQQKRQTGG